MTGKSPEKEQLADSEFKQLSLRVFELIILGDLSEPLKLIDEAPELDRPHLITALHNLSMLLRTELEYTKANFSIQAAKKFANSNRHPEFF